MGFGILFIAFVLLLNTVYYAYTDILCAALFLMALTRLAPIRREFSLGAAVAALFLLLGVGEFSLTLYEMFHTTDGIKPALAIVRYLILCALTVITLLGIRQTAKEVGIGRLAVRCESTVVMAPIAYLASILLEIPALFVGMQMSWVGALAAIVLLFTILMHVINAITVYKAYAGICMPEDASMDERPSRFAFVNRMRDRAKAREEAKRQEAAKLIARKKANKKKR